MLKFDQATLSDGKLTLGGPAEPNPGMEVKHLRFLIAQEGVMVEDEADEVSASGWTWEGSADGLQPGSAHGFGLAVMSRSQPPGFETFSWVEEVTLTSGAG